MNENLFLVKDLNLDLDGHKILKNINLEIKRGDFLGLLGPSGSGKTTLLLTLIGIYTPSSGEITYCGKELKSKLNELKKNIGFAVQNFSFYHDLTVKQNIAYFGKLFNVSNKLIKQRTEELLSFVELNDCLNIKAGKLSGGQQRRLDLACALIHDPEILFFDEPLKGLDPILRESTLELIKKVANTGKTIILSSHFLNEIEGHCKKLCILKDGEIKAFGNPIDIRKNFANMYEIELQSYPGNYLKILNLLKTKALRVLQYKITSSGITLYLPKTENTTPINYLKFVLGSLPDIKENMLSFRVGTLTFEEVFSTVIKNDK